MDKVDFVKQQLVAIAPDAEWVSSDSANPDRADELARILVREGITDIWALKLIPVKASVDEIVYELSPGVYGLPRETESGVQWDVISLNGRTVVRTEGNDNYGKRVVIRGYEDSYAFDYYGKRIGFLGTQDRRENRASFEKSQKFGYLLAWSSAGKGHVNYVVYPNQELKRLQIIPVWGSSSDAGWIRSSLISVISFFAFTALPMAGISLGAVIGNTVLPATFAAAYPGLTTVIGNVALSTALNGGDIESSVKNAVFSAIGANAGGFAGDFFDSNLIGSLTGAATRAALSGGDIKEAVLFTALQSGVTSMFDFDLTAGGQYDAPIGQQEWDFGNWQNVDPGFNFWTQPGGPADLTGLGPIYGGGDSLSNWNFDLPWQQNVDSFNTWQFSPVASEWSFGGNPFQPAIDFTVGLNADFNPIGFDAFSETGSQFLTQTPTGVQAPSNAPPPNSPVYQPAQVIKALTDAALQVIKLYYQVRGYTGSQIPIQTTARNVNPDGSVSVIGNNGLIQTRSPNGQITSTVPPVGVPQATLDGNYIINNGNGTYQIISPSGQSRTIEYGSGVSGAGGLSGSMLAIAGLGLFALLK